VKQIFKELSTPSTNTADTVPLQHSRINFGREMAWIVSFLRDKKEEIRQQIPPEEDETIAQLFLQLDLLCK